MRHSRCRAGLQRLQFGVVARQANVLRRPQPTNWQFTTLRPSRYRSSDKSQEGRDDLVRAFDDAGLTARLRLVDHRTWIPLRP